MCDIRSVDTNDMQRLDEVHTEDFLESYQIQYNEGQKWWYLSEQRPDEVLVFKGADSEIRGAGKLQKPRNHLNNTGRTIDEVNQCLTDLFATLAVLKMSQSARASSAEFLLCTSMFRSLLCSSLVRHLADNS